MPVLNGKHLGNDRPFGTGNFNFVPILDFVANQNHKKNLQQC